MLKFRFVAAAIVAAEFACLTGAQAQSVNNFGQFVHDSPAFYIVGGAVVMKRGNPDNGTFVAANPAGTPFFTGNQIKFGWDTGFDGAVGVRIMPRHSLELRYLHVDSDANFSFLAPGNFIGAGFTGPGGTRLDTANDTRLRSWELNWRYQLSDQHTVLAGYRTIRLRDSQRMALNLGVATGFYNYSNELHGAQIGVDWALLPRNNPFQINLSGKVGLFRLNASGGIDEFSGVNYIGGFYGRDSDNVLAGEIGVSVGYRIRNNVFLRAGYQLLVFDDVALASNAASRSLLVPSLLRSVETNSLVYQGVNLGLTVNW